MKMTDGSSGAAGSQASTSSSPSVTVEVSDTELSQMVEVLSKQRDMLAEYFSLNFALDEEKKVLRLTSLPVLLENHSPPPAGLPLFLMRLATEVDYTDEKACFEGICSELGTYYASLPVAGAEGGGGGGGGGGEQQFIEPEAAQYVKHVLHPALSFLLVPPTEFSTDGSVKRMALLSSLYKVFERC